MADRSFDTIVIGLGAMGASSAYQLARRGDRVLGLEQYDIPNARGSSHGSSRAIRLCYHEHPDYVPLLKRAYELWRELEEETGSKLLHITGGMYMGPPGGELVAGAARSGAEHGLAHEVLSRDEIARRYPQFRLPEHFAGVYEPEAGYLLPERIIAAYAALALGHGAQLRGHEGVVSWRADGAGVEVVTERGVYRAGRLVIAAGAWAQRVIGEEGGVCRVTPTRQVLGWVWPKRPELFGAERFPVWAIEAGDARGGLFYGFPMEAAGETQAPGLKVARHLAGPETDPDRVERGVTAADEEDFRPALREHIPDGDGPLLAMRACMYENSPDGHFVVDRLEGMEQVVVAAGFSGHGFKFASVVGEVVAEGIRVPSSEFRVPRGGVGGAGPRIGGWGAGGGGRGTGERGGDRGDPGGVAGR